MTVSLPSLIANQQPAVAALCRRTRAKRLALFGSAACGRFDPAASDLDFLVVFEELPAADYSDAYFELKQGLESLFERSVDLLTEANLRNPYLRQRVEAEKLMLYGS
jgi:uncharacterized protein